VIDQIKSTIEALVPLPHQSHRRSDLTSRPLRFTTAGSYLIAYAPDKRPMWVVAVMHGSRSPRVMAAVLRDRE
jgi:plasmid stabilization system protein ParE